LWCNSRLLIKEEVVFPKPTNNTKQIGKSILPYNWFERPAQPFWITNAWPLSTDWLETKISFCLCIETQTLINICFRLIFGVS
jgi:hypothetical protein